MRVTSSRGLVWLAVVLLILASVALHTYHFHDRNFRQDDVNTVHAAQIFDLSEVVQWMARSGVHPAGWRVLATSYLKILGEAGKHEPIARYFSTLTTLIALALLFRLSADLFDAETALYAVFILGTLPFAVFYMHELRPYPMLVLVTVGLQLSFLRWLHHRDFKHALLYVMFGVVALQTHYFGAYAIAAQVVTLVVLVRWDRGLYVRAFGLFAAIGLSELAWALPLLNRWFQGNESTYARLSRWKTLETLHHEMQIDPVALGQFLLIVGLLVPVGAVYWRLRNRHYEKSSLLRFAPEWRKLYLLILPVTAIILSFVVNVFARTVTPRNLILIVPPLAVVAALAMRQLPWQARLATVVLIAYPAVTSFQVFVKNAPYQEVTQFIAADYQPGDQIVTHIADPSAITQSFMYYLLDRLPEPVSKDSMFHIGGSGFGPNSADPVVNWVSDSERETLEQFAAFIDLTSRIWFIEYEYRPSNLGKPFLNVMKRQFAAGRIGIFPTERGGHYTVTEYRRIPESVQDLFHFGEAVSLQAWTLRESVNVEPCQAVTLESWWTALSQPAISYGIGLVLADAGGNGIAQTDDLPSGLPTSEWEPGDFQFDTHTLRVPCDVGPGEYPLLIGLYDYSTTEPVPAALPDGTPTGSNLVYLTTLIVD
jgi:hypothetical protein